MSNTLASSTLRGLVAPIDRALSTATVQHAELLIDHSHAFTTISLAAIASTVNYTEVACCLSCSIAALTLTSLVAMMQDAARTGGPNRFVASFDLATLSGAMDLADITSAVHRLVTSFCGASFPTTVSETVLSR